MNSLISSSVDVGEVEAVDPRVGSGAAVGASEQREKEFIKSALLCVALSCVVPLVGVVGGLAWPLGAVKAPWGCFWRGDIAEGGEKWWLQGKYSKNRAKFPELSKWTS